MPFPMICQSHSLSANSVEDMYILYFLQSNCLLRLSRYIFILLFDVVLKVLNSSPTLRFRKLRNSFKLNIETVSIVVLKISMYHSSNFLQKSSNIVQNFVIQEILFETSRKHCLHSIVDKLRVILCQNILVKKNLRKHYLEF